MASLTGIEVKVLRKLGDIAVTASPDTSTRQLSDELGIPVEACNQAIRTLDELGAIKQTGGGYPEGKEMFVLVDPYAQQLMRDVEAQLEAREVAAAAPPDFVEQIKNRARRNPRTAIVIVVVLILAIAIPLVNQTIELIERVIRLLAD